MVFGPSRSYSTKHEVQRIFYLVDGRTMRRDLTIRAGVPEVTR